MIPAPVRETVLENGLKVLTVETSTSPTASMQVWYRVGSRYERTGITGISHIFEHLMFKGTERFPQGAFDRIVQENGMTYNAFTSHDYTAYYENMAADRLPIAMDLESDRMQGLLLEQESFLSEMAVIREERRQNVEDPPFGLLSELVEASVFQVHPYHWPIIGWMSDLETITLADVVRYYRDYYRPNNATLVVVGAVTHEQVVALAGQFFGPISRGPALTVPAVREPAQRGERTVSVRKEVQLPGILIAWRAPESTHRDAKILNVLEFILLHGRSSRLYRKLIYDEQLATGLSGGLHLRTDPSVFVLRATARPGIAIERIRDVFYASLEELARTPVSPTELHKAFRSIEADYIFSHESHLELAHNLGEEESRSSWRDWTRWLEDHESVTLEEIREAAARVFTERNRTVGLLIPDPGAGEMPVPEVPAEPPETPPEEVP